MQYTRVRLHYRNAMNDVALTLYTSINDIIRRKFETGEFETEEEANTYGNSITAVFSQACFEAGGDDFTDLMEEKLRDAALTELPRVVEAAAHFYKVMNTFIMIKYKAGHFASEDEAAAYGKEITEAFAEACLEAGEDDFTEIFKSKLP